MRGSASPVRGSNLKVSVSKNENTGLVSKVERPSRTSVTKDESPNMILGSLQEEEERRQVKHWYELRLDGKPPERRAYHSSFIHNKR